MGNCYFRPADEAGGVAGAYSKLLVPYEKACYQDNDLLRMHEMLHKGMGSVLQILISRNALSLDLLRRAVSFLDDCNNQTVAVILDSKENIFNNDIRCLVKDYLELSKKTRSSLFALKEDLINLQEKQAFLLSDVLDGFSPEDTKRKAKAPLKLKKAKVEEMLSKLNSFKSAGCFADGFRQSFPALLEQHKQMVEKMQQQRIRLRKKLTTILWCKKIIFTIFAAVFAASLICSIIAAALHAAPMVISVVTAAISVTSWGPLAKMLDGLWKGDELGHGARLGAMNNLEKRSTAVLHELESIAVLVEGLEQKLGDQVRAVGNTVKIAHDEFLSFKEAIEKNSREVQVCVQDLLQIVESCMNHLDIRRDEVLSRRIMEMPFTSSSTTEVQKPWLCWWAK